MIRSRCMLYPRLVTVLLSLVCAVSVLGADAPGFLGFLYTLQTDAPPATKQWLHVQTVLPGGPAHAAGLRPQDIIVAINGKPVQFKTKLALIEFFAPIRPLTTVRFTVVRGAKRSVISVRAAQMSPEVAERWKQNYELAKQLDTKQ